MADITNEKLTFEETQLLAWKAGLTYTRPLPSALPDLQVKGLVSDGDILSSKITEAGHRALNETEGE